MLLSLMLSVTLLARGAEPGATLDHDTLLAAVDRVLAANQTSGSFVLYDEQRQRFLRSDPQQSRMLQIPASTFKILNALIALETGVVEDQDQVIAWDGRERRVKAWNQDQTLRSAIRYSAVWAFQWIARRVGRETMQRFLDEVGYGNGQIGERIDEFWLDGSLRISPEQQVAFLRRLYHHQLPFQKRHLETVRELIVQEQSGHYRLSGKTGWEIRSDPNLGWFVGYLERGGQVWFFALHVAIHSDGRGRNRRAIAEQILEALGLLDR